MSAAAERPKDDSATDRLEDLFLIGQGGMATVHVSRLSGEGGFQKLVAVKRMRTDVAESERARLMFLDEARLAAHISSPHVVTTLDLGKASDGSLYIVMELVLGPTVSQVMGYFDDLGTLPPLDVATEILAQAADGLDDAHEASTPTGKALQLVHRDVTPRNILIGLDGRVRITDFGIARAKQRLHQTVGSEVKGTFAYMSPEQLRSGPVDCRADVFSLGCVAFELLTGQSLFRGETPLDVMENVLLKEVPSLSEVRNDVPQALAEAIRKALERDASRRFGSARAFSDALRHAARDTFGKPSAAELRSFAERAGSRAVERLNTQIKTALASSIPPAMSSDHADTVPDVGATMTATVPEAIRERPLEIEIDTDTDSAAPEPASPWKWVAVAFGVLLAIAGGVVAWQALRVPGGGPGPVGGEAAAGSRDVSEVQAGGEESAGEGNSVELAQPAAAAGPAVNGDETTGEGTPEQAEGTAPVATPAVESRPTRPRGTRPVRPRVPMGMAAAPTITPPVMESGRMGTGLVGLDAFDSFGRGMSE